jgi:hypothetical protein
VNQQEFAKVQHDRLVRVLAQAKAARSRVRTLGSLTFVFGVYALLSGVQGLSSLSQSTRGPVLHIVIGSAYALLGVGTIGLSPVARWVAARLLAAVGAIRLLSGIFVGILAMQSSPGPNSTSALGEHGTACCSP